MRNKLQWMGLALCFWLPVPWGVDERARAKPTKTAQQYTKKK